MIEARTGLSANESVYFEIQNKLMEGFQTNLNILKPLYTGNREERTQRTRPLICVVVSLREEDETMLTSKMFHNSLGNLIDQASGSDIDLDMIVVANSGGAHKTELGKKVVDGLSSDLSLYFGDNLQQVDTIEPVSANTPYQPWEIPASLTDKRIEGENRCLLVVQQQDQLNDGKIRALRDVSQFLYNQSSNGYIPDAIFQMDAETVLKFRPTGLTELTHPPLRVLYDALKRRDGLVAISPKHLNSVMNSNTGLPYDGLRPFLDEMSFIRNSGKRENFKTLIGGAILAEPEYYIAAMKAISNVTLGSVAEDYLLTQLLRHYSCGNPDDPIKLNIAHAITAANRSETGVAAFRLRKRWREYGMAVDNIFPEEANIFTVESKWDAALKTFALRHKQLQNDKRKFVMQVIKDLGYLPGSLWYLLSIRKPVDPVNGDSGWKHH